MTQPGRTFLLFEAQQSHQGVEIAELCHAFAEKNKFRLFKGEYETWLKAQRLKEWIGGVVLERKMPVHVLWWRCLWRRCSCW